MTPKPEAFLRSQESGVGSQNPEIWTTGTLAHLSVTRSFLLNSGLLAPDFYRIFSAAAAKETG